MANIKKYEKKDGSVAYQFSVYLGVDEKTGKKKRTTRRGFKTKKEAKHALARLQAGVDKPQTKDYKKYTTFEDIYKLWWDTYTKKGLKPSTLANTSLYFRVHILPKFGSMPIKGITVLDCQEIINSWSSLNKCNSYKGYASNVFQYAVKIGLIVSNPLNLVDMPKKIPSQKKDCDKYYTQPELIEFLTWIKDNRPERDYAIFRLLAYSGMRRGELYVLNWSDIDFDNDSVRINKSAMNVGGKYIIAPPKTTFSNRSISLDKKTINILKHWKLSQKKDFFRHGVTVYPDEKQLLFSNRKNNFLTIPHLKNIMDKYPGKRLTPHGLRHTHATLLLNNGVSVNDVQHRLGHAKATMTLNVYGHASTDDSYVANRFVNLIEGYSKG